MEQSINWLDDAITQMMTQQQEKEDKENQKAIWEFFVQGKSKEHINRSELTNGKGRKTKSEERKSDIMIAFEIMQKGNKGKGSKNRGGNERPRAVAEKTSWMDQGRTADTEEMKSFQ